MKSVIPVYLSLPQIFLDFYYVPDTIVIDSLARKVPILMTPNLMRRQMCEQTITASSGYPI